MLHSGKRELRKLMRNAVKALSASERAQQSEAVQRKVLGLRRWKNARNVCVYLSLNDELCTDGMVEEALRTRHCSVRESAREADEGMACWAPVVVGEHDMKLVALRSLEHFRTLPCESKWGIRGTWLTIQLLHKVLTSHARAAGG